MAMALGQTVKSDCGSATDSLTYSHPSEIWRRNIKGSFINYVAITLGRGEEPDLSFLHDTMSRIFSQEFYCCELPWVIYKIL